MKARAMLPSRKEIDAALRGVPLAEYRARAAAQPLPPAERLLMLDALERVLSGIYTHLPLKHARYGFDPVQRLRILRTQAKDLSGEAFNAEVGDIFARLRDGHTLYSRPGAPDRVAALPFMVEMYGSFEAPHYLVSKVGPAVRDGDFKAGVEIETWNGMPIDRAVQRHGDREAGGRADSMRGWVLVTLTQRPLQYYDLPDEDSVDIGFRNVGGKGRRAGKRLHATFDWTVIDTGKVEEFQSTERKKAGKVRAMALNPAAAAVKRAKLLLFASNTLRGESVPRPEARPSPAKGSQSEIETSLKMYLRAGTIQGSRAEQQFGYLRIFTFDVESTREFLEEVRRLLLLMPPRGLIIDIRDNPGGVVVAAEVVLQFLTPRAIEPARFSLLATDFSRTFSEQVSNRDEYDKWRPSLVAAIRNGELYSAAFPITDTAKCNLAGQVYGGPVVLVTSSTTYSSGDLFSAGFVDNDIGPMICVGAGTGGGGACVSTYEDVRGAFAGSRQKLPALPETAGLSIALMRATRIGAQSGTPIEDVGVAPAPEQRYAMTRDDLLHENCDLLAKCVGLLEKRPHTVMKCELNPARDTLHVATEGLDQIDVRIDGWSLASVRLEEGQAHAISVPRGTRRIEVQALKAGELKQRRVLDPSIVLPDD